MRPKLGSRLQSVSGSPLAPFASLPWASQKSSVNTAWMAASKSFQAAKGPRAAR